MADQALHGSLLNVNSDKVPSSESVLTSRLPEIHSIKIPTSACVVPGGAFGSKTIPTYVRE